MSQLHHPAITDPLGDVDIACAIKRGPMRGNKHAWLALFGPNSIRSGELGIRIIAQDRDHFVVLIENAHPSLQPRANQYISALVEVAGSSIRIGLTSRLYCRNMFSIHAEILKPLIGAISNKNSRVRRVTRIGKDSMRAAQLPVFIPAATKRADVFTLDVVLVDVIAPIPIGHIAVAIGPE